jgi:division protein CdvB (Snf7/Vps24/ESCRT-III family)
MSSITPPFDLIPRVPGELISKVSSKINDAVSKLNQQVQKTIKDTTKLPNDCKCDDPRVRRVKNQLTEVQKQITEIQNSITQIQNVANTVKGVVQTAVAIKASISAAQLLNPVTAPVFIAQQLTAVQDTIIVNSLTSLNQFAVIPSTITSNLALVVPQITDAINKLGQICNFSGDNTADDNSGIEKLKMDPAALAEVTNLSVLLDGNTDLKSKLNSEVVTEFYNEYNVSNTDLINRSEEIQVLLDSLTGSVTDTQTLQIELQKSILEAPSVVYKQAGIPQSTVGKPGDYYIDTQNYKVYGPKLSFTNWGSGSNIDKNIKL